MRRLRRPDFRRLARPPLARAFFSLAMTLGAGEPALGTSSTWLLTTHRGRDRSAKPWRGREWVREWERERAENHCHRKRASTQHIGGCRTSAGWVGRGALFWSIGRRVEIARWRRPLLLRAGGNLRTGFGRAGGPGADLTGVVGGSDSDDCSTSRSDAGHGRLEPTATTTTSSVRVLPPLKLPHRVSPTPMRHETQPDRQPAAQPAKTPEPTKRPHRRHWLHFPKWRRGADDASDTDAAAAAITAKAPKANRATAGINRLFLSTPVSVHSLSLFRFLTYDYPSPLGWPFRVCLL